MTMGYGETARDPQGRPLLDDIQDFWAKHWWALALRGACGIVFGIAAFLLPVATILTLVILFAAYMLADGVLAIVAGVRARRRGEKSWPMFLEGIADLVAGGIAAVLPGITIFVLIYLLGFWAIVSGAFLIAAGLRRARREWLLVLDGGLSLIWGALIIFWLITQPQVSVVAVTWWIGLYALVFGVLLLVAGLPVAAAAGSRLSPRGVPPGLAPISQERAHKQKGPGDEPGPFVWLDRIA